MTDPKNPVPPVTPPNGTPPATPKPPVAPPTATPTPPKADAPADEEATTPVEGEGTEVENGEETTEAGTEQAAENGEETDDTEKAEGDDEDGEEKEEGEEEEEGKEEEEEKKTIDEIVGNPDEARREMDYVPITNEEFQAKTKEIVLPTLMKFFHPELLNRFDDIVFFSPLRPEELAQIVDIMMREPREMLAEKDMQIKISDSAKDFLAKKGYNPAFGARPLRRAIQSWIEDPLADKLIRGVFKDGDVIFADVAEDAQSLVFKKDVADDVDVTGTGEGQDGEDGPQMQYDDEGRPLDFDGTPFAQNAEGKFVDGQGNIIPTKEEADEIAAKKAAEEAAANPEATEPAEGGENPAENAEQAEGETPPEGEQPAEGEAEAETKEPTEEADQPKKRSIFDKLFVKPKNDE
jgi:hypothetical protein